LWSDVTLATETDLGFVIHFSLGKTAMGKEIASKSYISKSCLSDESIAFITQKSPAVA